MSEDVLGIQSFTAEDRRAIAGSRFSVVRDTIFANPCQKVWRPKANAPFEHSQSRSCR